MVRKEDDEEGRKNTACEQSLYYDIVPKLGKKLAQDDADERSLIYFFLFLLRLYAVTILPLNYIYPRFTCRVSIRLDDFWYSSKEHSNL
jgi:hypothetical protein